MAAILVLLFWLYTHLRLRYIRNKNRQLENLVSERTEELLKALSALSVSEQNIRRQMQVREVFFTAISHDIGSPLRYITMIAENLKDSLAKDHARSQEAKYADGIFQSGHYLYYLTRNLLQYLRISDEGNSLHFEQFNLHALIATKVKVFEPIASERMVTIINEVPESYELYSDPLVCEVVVHNLLDNAIKAALKGTIRIYVSKGQLIIEDSGPGMSKAMADHYSGRAPYPETADSRLKQGFGLEIVQELTQLSGIGLNIETSPTGTKICLAIPSIPDHNPEISPDY
jgi:signal transduction histidine kinase